MEALEVAEEVLVEDVEVVVEEEVAEEVVVEEEEEEVGIVIEEDEETIQTMPRLETEIGEGGKDLKVLLLDLREGPELSHQDLEIIMTGEGADLQETTGEIPMVAIEDPPSVTDNLDLVAAETMDLQSEEKKVEDMVHLSRGRTQAEATERQSEETKGGLHMMTEDHHLTMTIEEILLVLTGDHLLVTETMVKAQEIMEQAAPEDQSMEHQSRGKMIEGHLMMIEDPPLLDQVVVVVLPQPPPTTRNGKSGRQDKENKIICDESVKFDFNMPNDLFNNKSRNLCKLKIVSVCLNLILILNIQV